MSISYKRKVFRPNSSPQVYLTNHLFSNLMHINQLQQIAFIIIYVIYLIVALSGQAIYARMQGNYAISETQAENNLQEKTEISGE